MPCSRLWGLSPVVDGAEEGGCSSAEARRERKTFYYYSAAEGDWTGVEDDRVVFNQVSGLWAS